MACEFSLCDVTLQQSVLRIRLHGKVTGDDSELYIMVSDTTWAIPQLSTLMICDIYILSLTATLLAQET